MYEKCQILLSEKFPFLVVKCSIYLNSPNQTFKSHRLSAHDPKTHRHMMRVQVLFFFQLQYFNGCSMRQNIEFIRVTSISINVTDIR